MQDLWGRETELALPQHHTPKQPVPPSPPRLPAVLECASYGHSWQRIGLCAEKRCTVCGITGYCPGCTPIPPQGARPFYCTRHTLMSPAGVPASSFPREKEQEEQL